MATLYTPKHAAELLGISASAIRLYTTRYKIHLSTEATATPRRFTEGDLRFVAFVGKKTEEGKSHEAILTYLETPEGEAEYDEFEWKPTSQEKDPVIDAGPGTMLVPVERLVAVQAMLQSQQEERQRLLDRERELLDQLHRLQREVGKAEGKIESLEAQLKQQQPPPPRKPPAWWVRLFGGE
jgi:DNA-binding transcriptional MerR regulator